MFPQLVSKLLRFYISCTSIHTTRPSPPGTGSRPLPTGACPVSYYMGKVASRLAVIEILLVTPLPTIQ